MCRYKYSNEIVNVVKKLLNENEWNYFFNEETGVFEFNPGIRSNIYGNEKATTIINNCDTIVFLGSMDLETGRNISMRANRPLEDILYMPVGSEIIFRRGMKPISTKRYNIFQNEMYKKVTAVYDRKIKHEILERCQVYEK